MKKVLFAITLLALIFCIGYILLLKNETSNNVLEEIIRTPDVTANCSDVRDLVITAETELTIVNNTSETHNNVTVKVVGYDNNGNITKQKSITFDRALEPNSSLSRPVTFPARTLTCSCEFESSN